MTHCKQARPVQRMLVVEDEPVLLAALDKYFTGEGFDVDSSSELEEAEALIATTRYDIVLADLRLSGTYAVEGLAILRFIRQHSRGTRVIILTAHTSADVESNANDLGARAFLPKPTSLPEIAATIGRVMAVAS